MFKIAFYSIKLLPFVWVITCGLWVYMWIDFYASTGPHTSSDMPDVLFVQIFTYPLVSFFFIRWLRNVLIRYVNSYLESDSTSLTSSNN